MCWNKNRAEEVCLLSAETYGYTQPRLTSWCKFFMYRYAVLAELSWSTASLFVRYENNEGRWIARAPRWVVLKPMYLLNERDFVS
jgi:hypothetical protein